MDFGRGFVEKREFVLLFQSPTHIARQTHADDEEQDKSDDDGDYANEILRVGYRRDDFAMASYHVQTLIFVLRYDLRQRRTTEMSVSANPQAFVVVDESGVVVVD